MLCGTRDIGCIHLIAALIILLREIAVSGLREFLAQLQVSVPVSKLAKWKTTLQLVALGALILAGAFPGAAWIGIAGLAALWGAAGLTLVTGWDYLRAGLKYMDRSEEHTSELQSLMRISYAVFCLKKKNT